MNVNTGGRVRGFLARWIMRLEASGQIIRMGFLGVTAASTLTSALALIGYESMAKWVLLAGVLGTFAFAWAYTELGIFNRKNRERADFGDNYSGPTMYMDRSIDAEQRAYLAWLLDPEDRTIDYHQDNIQQLTHGRWEEFRNGMSPEEIKQ